MAELWVPRRGRSAPLPAATCSTAGGSPANSTGAEAAAPEPSFCMLSAPQAPGRWLIGRAQSPASCEALHPEDVAEVASG